MCAGLGFKCFICHGSNVSKLVFFLALLYLLHKEAAVRQTEDFKQLRNEKKILEKEFKKTQVPDPAV